MPGLSRSRICGLGAIALVMAATACSGSGGDDKTSTPATPAERHLTFIGGELEATERQTEAKSSVWIADPSGAHARKLTNGFLGLLSPDGKTVAVQRLGKGIFLVSSDGKQTKQLTAAPQLRPQAWSPDGKLVYVTADAGNAVVRLAAVDRDSGTVKTIATGSLYGIDTSPDGKQIVYSRAPEATEQGICGDQFDLYVANPDGSSKKRLTNDGLSAFPVWGESRIAFSHFPSGRSLEDCSSPGIWTIDPDGGKASPVISRAPASIVLLGLFGLQPIGWLDKQRLLVGLRSEYGTKAAVLDTKSRRMRQFNDYAEHASSDGRYYVGSGGDTGVALTIRRIEDGHRMLRRQNACCPSWNR